uniref:Uncharacterized protein n=1 Tax=viral metagenome TaxID=1070528 RepID=A0A6C0K0C3_9ZZZZ
MLLAAYKARFESPVIIPDRDVIWRLNREHPYIKFAANHTFLGYTDGWEYDTYSSRWKNNMPSIDPWGEFHFLQIFENEDFNKNFGLFFTGNRPKSYYFEPYNSAALEIQHVMANDLGINTIQNNNIFHFDGMSWIPLKLNNSDYIYVCEHLKQKDIIAGERAAARARDAASAEAARARFAAEFRRYPPAPAPAPVSAPVSASASASAPANGDPIPPTGGRRYLKRKSRKYRKLRRRRSSTLKRSRR